MPVKRITCWPSITFKNKWMGPSFSFFHFRKSILFKALVEVFFHEFKTVNKRLKMIKGLLTVGGVQRAPLGADERDDPAPLFDQVHSGSGLLFCDLVLALHVNR